MLTKRLYVANLIFGLLPSTRCFAIKVALLRWAGAVVGQNVRIVSSARFWLTGELSIGDNTWIGHEVLVVGGSAAVIIGRNVDVAPRVVLATGTHEQHTTQGKAAGVGYSEQIEIKDGAWIGVSTTILGGVIVGSEAIVGAGALVNRSVSPRARVGGVPAKEI